MTHSLDIIGRSPIFEIEGTDINIKEKQSPSEQSEETDKGSIQQNSELESFHPAQERVQRPSSELDFLSMNNKLGLHNLPKRLTLHSSPVSKEESEGNNGEKLKDEKSEATVLEKRNRTPKKGRTQGLNKNQKISPVQIDHCIEQKLN